MNRSVNKFTEGYNSDRMQPNSFTYCGSVSSRNRVPILHER